jgi:hypothetical protein
MTMEVFLHCDFGNYYVGCGLLGMVVIFVFTAFFPDQDPRPMVLFMAAYGVRWLVVAIKTGIKYWRGKGLVHSRYSGRPYLWRLLPDWKETNVKYVEGLAVMLLGWLVHFYLRPFGDYLMTAAALVMMRGYTFDMDQRDRAVEMNDSVIETQMVAERFRDMQSR